LEPNPQSWIPNAEAAIRALREIEDVRIKHDGENISEIHVVTTSHRPAKNIVRDVQSVLEAKWKHTIDHRVVSVAFTKSADAPVVVPHPVAAAPIGLHPAPVPAPNLGLHATLEPAEAPEDRIRFGSVNLYVTGARAQAQVELRWKGVLRTGSATGWSSRDAAFRLVATATLNAVQEFVDDEIGLGLAEIELVRIGRQDAVIVGLTLLAHRQEKLLVGSCTVEQDAQQAVALATLAGLNRVLGGLRTKEPTEYILRPSSAQEVSGAKRS